MNFRLTPRALADAKRMKTWWQRHRSKAPHLFDEELRRALARAAASPELGRVYREAALPREVRRVLMAQTSTHVYYVVDADEVVVLALWGATKGRGPKL